MGFLCRLRRHPKQHYHGLHTFAGVTLYAAQACSTRKGCRGADLCDCEVTELTKAYRGF